MSLQFKIKHLMYLTLGTAVVLAPGVPGGLLALTCGCALVLLAAVFAAAGLMAGGRDAGEADHTRSHVPDRPGSCARCGGGRLTWAGFTADSRTGARASYWMCAGCGHTARVTAPRGPGRAPGGRTG